MRREQPCPDTLFLGVYEQITGSAERDFVAVFCMSGEISFVGWQHC
jgi:hypothetical protein